MSEGLRLSSDLKLYVATRFVVTIAVQMQAVAVGWQVYDLTHRALALGYVGLAQFAPFVALALLTGHVADRFERRRILMVCYAVIALCALMFAALTLWARAPVELYYLVLVLLGSARAFLGPASQSFVPELVPPSQLQ